MAEWISGFNDTEILIATKELQLKTKSNARNNDSKLHLPKLKQDISKIRINLILLFFYFLLNILFFHIPISIRLWNKNNNEKKDITV